MSSWPKEWHEQFEAKQTSHYTPLDITQIKMPQQYSPSVSKPPLFSITGGGFTFIMANWSAILTNGERERFAPDAIAHRLEAHRRMVICRLEGDREHEVLHWTVWVDRFTKLFHLPEITDDGGKSPRD